MTIHNDIQLIPKCPTCDGTCFIECDCGCNGEQLCDECLGTGYDPEVFDVQKYSWAMGDFVTKHVSMSDWIVDGKIVGFMSQDGKHTLDARAFLKTKGE